MMEESKEVKQIPVAEIIPNRFQPRINFDEKALNDLSNSIKQHGIIQPLVVRPLGDKFEIIAGERRYKAASMAGLATVPAIVTDMDDSTSAEVALIENVQRKDLTAIEEAKSYKNMLDRGNMTQEELAKKMGLSQSTIANKLRLLNLSDEVQKALMNEKISERHARSLLSIQNKDDQVRWLNRIINERLTVRQLDLAIKDEISEKNLENQNDGDIPIVNINPDIESIISNSVDINQPEEKPKVDVFNGLTPINDAPEVNKEPEDIVNMNNNETSVKEVPNKFFNFLEDEEVNMSFDDKPVELNGNDDITENKNSEIFSFSPEFMPSTNESDSSLDNDFNANKFAEFDLANNNVVNNSEIDTIDSLDVTPTETNVIATPINDSIEQLSEVDTLDIDENNIQQNQEPVEDLFGTSDNVQEVSSEVVEQPITSVNDTDEGYINNKSNSYIQKDDSNVDVTPIPVVEDDTVLDPVKLFDTLEPDFYEKIKENAGLDLKTAINDYRDLTNELISRGFNINIDEVDQENNYKITIDITKE